MKIFRLIGFLIHIKTMYVHSITDSDGNTVHIKDSELQRVLRDFCEVYIFKGSISANVIYDTDSITFIYSNEYRFTEDRYLNIIIDLGLKHEEYMTSSEPSSSSESETDEPVKNKSKIIKNYYTFLDSRDRSVKIKHSEIHRVLYDFGKAYRVNGLMCKNSVCYYPAFKAFCYRGKYSFSLLRYLEILYDISLKHVEYKTSIASSSENKGDSERV